jgi:hypothetical protein
MRENLRENFLSVSQYYHIRGKNSKYQPEQEWTYLVFFHGVFFNY